MQQEQAKREAGSLRIPNFTIADDILYRQVESEAVLLHIPSGMYYSLNHMGVKFWEALRIYPPELVINQIVTEYQVEYSQIHHDLLTFLEDLADYGVIAWSSD